MNKNIPSITIDTMNGRDMRTSSIVIDCYDTIDFARPPHLAAPENRKKLKELPF